MNKNTICLWYDHDAEDAARFYARTFPDSAVGAVHRAPADFPGGKAGDVLTVAFTVCGVMCHSERSTGLPTRAASRRDSNAAARCTLPSRSSGAMRNAYSRNLYTQTMLPIREIKLQLLR